MAEPLRLHRGLSARQSRTEAINLLERVGIAQAAQRFGAYPHQFSGGQRQRITIAMALACGPDLLIADEPTTALDVTVQRQILELIAGLVAERGMALILISHDLGVIAQNVWRTLVMYGGTVVESGPTRARVRQHMAHPYTQGLFAARPRLGAARLPRRPPAHHCRQRARSGRPAHGLPVCRALPAHHRRLPRRPAPGGGAGRGP